MLTARARRRTAASVACGTLAGALAAAFFVRLAWAVDAAFIGGSPLGSLAPELAGLALLALGRAAAAWAAEVCANAAASDAKAAVRDRLVRALIRRGPGGLAAERTGELARTLVGGVESIEAYAGQYLPQAALAAAVPLLVFVAVFALDPLSALVLAVTGPLIPLFTWLIGGAARARTRRQFVTLSRLSARFLDGVRALPVLKAFGCADREAAVIARASDRFRAVTMSVLRVAFLSALTLELLATIGVAIVAVEVGLRLLYARLAFRDAFAVLLLAPEFYRPLRNLGAAFHAGLAGREALARVREIEGPEAPGPEPRLEPRPDLVVASRAQAMRAPLPAPPHFVAGRPPRRDANDAAGSPPAISFRRVAFSYPGAGRPAVAGIDLEIPAGRTLALVGPSGSGKTTLAGLLLRFLEPDAGEILAGGVPLRAWARDEWLGQVAWVPQQPHVFHGTIRDNLRLARPDAGDGALAEALERARADAFVRGLPAGLDTPVGERGQRLSGGEAQRIALARAFLKDAPILVLDEPTAHLDPGHEAAIRASMSELRQGRTVLLIAHRLTTVADADTVAVLAGGRLVEAGTRESLLASGGRYAAMLAAYGGAA